MVLVVNQQRAYIDETCVRYYESKRIKLKGEDEWSYDRLQRVSFELKGAQRELEVVRKELEGVQNSIFELGVLCPFFEK